MFSLLSRNWYYFYLYVQKHFNNDQNSTKLNFFGILVYMGTPEMQSRVPMSAKSIGHKISYNNIKHLKDNISFKTDKLAVNNNIVKLSNLNLFLNLFLLIRGDEPPPRGPNVARRLLIGGLLGIFPNIGPIYAYNIE